MGLSPLPWNQHSQDTAQQKLEVDRQGVRPVQPHPSLFPQEDVGGRTRVQRAVCTSGSWKDAGWRLEEWKEGEAAVTHAERIGVLELIHCQGLENKLG